MEGGVDVDAKLKKTNHKSDVLAKEAFCKVLRQRGFERVNSKLVPAKASIDNRKLLSVLVAHKNAKKRTFRTPFCKKARF